MLAVIVGLSITIICMRRKSRAAVAAQVSCSQSIMLSTD